MMPLEGEKRREGEERGGGGLTMPMEGGKRKGKEEVVSRCLSGRGKKIRKKERKNEGKGKKSLNQTSYSIYYFIIKIFEPYPHISVF
jgi:hypothetical protein